MITGLIPRRLLNRCKMEKTYVGIDNGATGSIGIIRSDIGKVRFGPTPYKTEQSYTKKEQNVSRVDVVRLTEFLIESCALEINPNVMVIIERPYVNPQGFKATMSAMRALEATLIVLEKLGLAFQYIDSKEWQTQLLPEGTKGPAALKKASLQIGTRLFPQVESKHKDRDGLLIAEYARRKSF